MFFSAELTKKLEKMKNSDYFENDWKMKARYYALVEISIENHNNTGT